MALYLDSADVEDACRAARLGFIRGATTNPALIHKTGRPAEQVVADAAEAGTRYIIPYVNRMTRLCGDGPSAVADMAAVLAGGSCEIPAASIKDPAEAV